MIIKKYIAATVKEAMNRISEDLGRDAVIISQRSIKKPGIKGFFSSKLIEVTAAVESKEIVKEDYALSSSNNKPVEHIGLKREVDDMRALLNHILNENKKSEEDRVIKKTSEDNEESKGPINRTHIIKFLHELDINEELTDELINNIPEDLCWNEHREKIMEHIKDYLDKLILIENKPMEGIIALIGPTGVGKTTTIAKIAGNLSLIHKKKVGLITVDTYRIGAVEQLKTYADIMNIPFKVVFSIGEMEGAIKDMEDCDVVLIDTTGRSSKNPMQLSELRAFLNKAKPTSTYLVMSATTKNKDIDVIVQGFSFIEYNSIIMTKLDETCTYGAIANLSFKSKKPLGFLTTGQNVPDDIKNPQKEDIISLILGESNQC